MNIYKNKALVLVTVIAFWQALFFLTTEVVKSTSVGVGLLETPDTITIIADPLNAETIPGGTVQYNATATFTSGAPDRDITSDPLTVWDSDDDGIATIDVVGLATGVSLGTTDIHATYGGETGDATIDVVEPPPPPPPPPTPVTGPRDSGVGAGFLPPEEEEEAALIEEERLPEEPTPERPTPGEPTPEAPEAIVSPVGELPPPLPPSPPPPGLERFAPVSIGELPPKLIPYIIRDLPEIPEYDLRIGIPPELQLPFVETDLAPIFLPPELVVTRGEIVELAIREFNLEETKKELLESCLDNTDACLSIFLHYTKFEDVIIGGSTQGVKVLRVFIPEAMAAVFELGEMYLYPDVPTDNEYSHPINIASLLSIIHGYYEEENSPFKPYKIITRMEALKVLLGSVDLMKWMYYDELETILGGEDNVRLQTTPFVDVVPTREYMWWYPRYIALACEVDMVDCDPGTKFRPDEFITDEEVQEMIDRLNKFLSVSEFVEELRSDPDKDGLLTYMEDMVTLTDYLNKDTDSDKLNDREEVIDYETNPFKKDSDNEGLSDYDEVKVHGTNPLMPDTDGDDFTDYLEVEAGTDPLDPTSHPRDDNNNGIDDNWEEAFGIVVIDGTQDTDGDGLSDKMEYQLRTDPTDIDTDNDGFTDAEELLQLGTDPLDPNDPGTLAEVGVRITNFMEGQLVSDTTPMIKGTAPAGMKVRTVIKNDYGHEKALGDVIADENDIFILQVVAPIRDGRYMLVAKALDIDRQRIIQSDPVHIIIDSTLDVEAPMPTKLAETEITEDVLLKNLRIEIRDNKPVLIGETDFGNRVTATWRSIVVTSALIADSVTGEFEIAAPSEMLLGNHEIFVTATRKKDLAQSDTIQILFRIGPPLPEEEVLKMAAAVGIPPFISYWFLLIFALIVLLVLLGAGYYYYVLGKGKKGKKG